MCSLCKWKAVLTLTVDPLCRVSCSSTAAGCTLNPDYTSETHENNISKNTKTRSRLVLDVFLLRKKKRKSNCCQGFLQTENSEKSGNPWGSTAGNIEGGGGGPGPHHKNHHRAAVHRVTSQVGSVEDMWRVFPDVRGEEMQQRLTTPQLWVCVCVCVCACMRVSGDLALH